MTQRYPLYPTLTQSAVRAVKQLDRRMRKASDQAILASYCQMNLAQQPHFPDSLTYHILAHEHFWESQGRTSLVVESEALADALLNAKFELDEAATIPTFFESFMLILPEGVRFRGVPLKSALVTTLPLNQGVTDVLYRFKRYSGVGAHAVTLSSRSADTQNICVMFADPSRKGEAIMGSVTMENWTQALGNGEILAAEIYDSALSKEEQTIQFALYKLVAAIFIYWQSTNGTCIEEGAPKFNAVGSPRDLPKTRHVVRFPDSHIAQANASTTPHLRGFHFRNLKHPRFYKGEHAALKPGSRWVPVSAATIGAELDLKTVKEVEGA